MFIQSIIKDIGDTVCAVVGLGDLSVIVSPQSEISRQTDQLTTRAETEFGRTIGSIIAA